VPRTRIARTNAGIALAALIFFDCAVIGDFRRHGAPTMITDESVTNGVVTFHIRQVPVSPRDWIALAVLVGLPLLLLFLICKSRHCRVDARQSPAA
jgi:hypothetical protein